jgi:chaperonin GroEL
MTTRRAQVVGKPDAQQQFLTGIHAVSNLLGPTMGPLGGHVAGSANTNKQVEVWDDAGTAVRRLIGLGTPQADIGAMLIRNMVWRLEQRVGDGGTTAAVLACEIASRGIRLLAAGVNPMELARGLRIAADAVVGHLRTQAWSLEDENDLSRLALTVTHHPELSTVLGEMRFLLGPEGHIHIEKFVAPYLERQYISGAHFKAQIASMYFYTDSALRTAVLNSPAVAIVDEPLRDVDAALPLLEAALEKKAGSLLIITPELSGAALNLLVTNQQAPTEKRKLGLLAVRLTALTDERSGQLTDVGVLTGASVLGEGRMRSPRKVRSEDIGVAERVEFGHDGLTVVATAAHRDDIRHEAEAVQQVLREMPFSDPTRPILTRRLATLSGGVGELKIGANSQLERNVLFDTAERALRVLTTASRHGVVPGGGAALVHASKAVKDLSLTGDIAFGASLLGEALSAPLRQIAHNAGADHPQLFAQRVLDAGGRATFDAFTSSVVDADEAGIVDSTEVTIATLLSAVSCALMALTTDTIVYHRNPVQSMEP